jgi:hypothetical protein
MALNREGELPVVGTHTSKWGGMKRGTVFRYLGYLGSLRQRHGTCPTSQGAKSSGHTRGPLEVHVSPRISCPKAPRPSWSSPPRNSSLAGSCSHPGAVVGGRWRGDPMWHPTDLNGTRPPPPQNSFRPPR